MIAGLGVDVGLSGTRAALVGEDGSVLARCSSRRESPVPAECLPGVWRREIADVVRGVMARSEKAPAALALGALGPSALLVGADLDVVAGPFLFNDVPPGEASGLPEDAGRLHAAALPGDNMLPTLWSVAERYGDALSSAVFVLDTTGYLVGWMTGEPVMDELTAADYMADGAGAPVALAPLRAPDAVAGGLRGEIAEALGLPEGLPVAVGTYDSYVDLMAMGLRSPGDAGLLLGTTFVAAALVDGRSDVSLPRALRAIDWSPTCRLVGGWTSSAGAALEWSRSTFAFSDEEESAAWRLPPGSGGVIFLPYLAGERAPVWDAAASGVLVGLTQGVTRGEICRAVLDGVVLSAREVCSQLRRHVQPSRWVAGGGGTRHTAWVQATADALGCELEIADASGGTGAGLLALRSLGMGEGRLERTSVVAPNLEWERRYEDLATSYETIYPSLRHTMHELRHLERGPS